MRYRSTDESREQTRTRREEDSRLNETHSTKLVCRDLLPERATSIGFWVWCYLKCDVRRKSIEAFFHFPAAQNRTTAAFADLRPKTGLHRGFLRRSFAQFLVLPTLLPCRCCSCLTYPAGLDALHPHRGVQATAFFLCFRLPASIGDAAKRKRWVGLRLSTQLDSIMSGLLRRLMSLVKAKSNA